MSIKIIGLFLTIFSGFLISLHIRRRYTLRIQVLEGLIADFQEIKAQVDFLKMELPEIFYRLSENTKGPLKQFYDRITEELGKGKRMGEAFKESVEQNRERLALTEKDSEILLDFAGSLGQTDYENQLEQILGAKELLSFQWNEALCGKEKNEKAQCAMALCGTAALGIILL